MTVDGQLYKVKLYKGTLTLRELQSECPFVGLFVELCRLGADGLSLVIPANAGIQRLSGHAYKCLKKFGTSRIS